MKVRTTCGLFFLVFMTSSGLWAQAVDDFESVTVNWSEEIFEGGATMVALGFLSVAMVMFTVERLWFLRRSRFVPEALLTSVDKALRGEGADAGLSLCRKSNTPLGDALELLIEHHHAGPDTAYTLAGDEAMRRMEAEERKAAPLAVIAGLAPLLGLLGTMIGMIEAFKLVEVFGDEGGASLLAGSISKALITTAGGLVIALPSLMFYHLARHRTGTISDALEQALTRAHTRWILSPEGPLSATPSQEAGDAAQA
ncbi:MAG: MotA/TolQ/ExbB proton channel family protein [Kiritimatiellia bacterium]